VKQVYFVVARQQAVARNGRQEDEGPDLQTGHSEAERPWPRARLGSQEKQSEGDDQSRPPPHEALRVLEPNHFVDKGWGQTMLWESRVIGTTSDRDDCHVDIRGVNIL
jgi:hypothetical protein